MHSYLKAWGRPGLAKLKRIVSRKNIHKKIHFYLGKNDQSLLSVLTLEKINTEIAEFVNIVDPDESTHYKLPHLNLQYLPSSFGFINKIQFILKVFRNFADIIL